MAEIKAAGIDYIEVTMNNFVRKQPENEVYIKAYQALKDIREAGLKVWSVHLPYSSTWDVSIIDPKKREAAVVFFEEMIRLAGIFEPECLVLHPGADNIKNANTRADRLKCARNSIGRLALVAKEIGAVLCVEDLPRTCPGRTADEIDYLTADIPNVKICFDTNHLLIDTHEEFFHKVGDRIGTIHVSDYDRIDEKHWLPLSGRGVVDWPAFCRNLKACGYKGVFMFESRGDGVTAEDVVRVYEQMKKLR
jgi:sugar phosphate isomerase/epimerase